MKRLLRVSLNAAIFSFIPILCWFALGLLVDKNLINVFTLTYPLQFIYSVISEIFGVGANVCGEKEKDGNSVLSGMTWGIIFGFLIFGFVVINIDSYINFMNMDVSIYKEFALYSVIQLYISVVFSFVLEKLYFEGKEKLANRYCLTLNILNLVVLVLSAIIFNEKIFIVISSLLFIFVYVLIITIKQYKKFKLNFKIGKYIKYNSVDIFNNLAFFIIYFFGLSNALDFGEEYIIALNFAALITDTQWDTTGAIITVAKIDISKNEFNYKEHIKNAYILTCILLFSSFIMFLLLYKYYAINIELTLIYLGIEIYNFIIYPIYDIKTSYLQLEWSSFKTTSNKMLASFGRTITSFFKTPFCTGIGQIVASTYQFISVNIIFAKYYKVNKKGYIVSK